MTYKKLVDVAKITMGTSPSGKTYNHTNVGVPLLNGPTEFGQTYPLPTLYTTDSKKECIEGDLLFCVRGSTTGRMNWANKVYSIGRGICSFSGESELETKFIRYCLETKLDNLLKLATGGTFPNLTKDTIESFEIPFPGNRIEIASILSTYDDLIENNNRRIAILEAMAQKLYREWFVKFRFPGHEDVKMVESELGLIPEGWEVVTASQTMEINPRTTLTKEGEKPYLSMSYLSENSMVIKGNEYRSGNSGTKFKNNDTLFARITPSLENGKTGYVQFLDDESPIGFGSTEFIILRAKTLTSEFVYCLARSNSFRDNAIKSMTGATGRQRVQNSCFDNYFFAQPTEDLLEKFTDIARPMFELVNSLHNKNLNLKKQRDLLLPKLISGKVSV